MPTNHSQNIIALGIVERGDRFLLVRRVDEGSSLWHHKWNIPGGGIEAGESADQAIIREVAEETGLAVDNPELLGVHTYHWRLPDRTIQTFLIVYRLRSEAGEISLDLRENDDHRWVTADEFIAIGEDEHLGGNLQMFDALYPPVRQRLRRRHDQIQR